MTERHLRKYKLLEEVGQGGMAVVYRGLDTNLDREVAVKILHKHLAEQEESKQRFQREAQAVAKLRHENIIEIYDYSGMDSDESYIVTEFIHGQTLKQYLSRYPISHPEIAALIIVELCNALEHAHSLGVIHRDIKPENIMIRDDGRVKLTDFGIAQVVDVQRLTVTGQLLGSPAYMAPELVRGTRIDFRADIFSIGTLLYQLATSELPFKGTNPHEVLKRIAEGRYIDPEVANPVVGSQLSRIIRKALAPEPDDRYGDVRELGDDLAGFLEEVQIIEYRDELTAYFDDPTGYSKALQVRVVECLTVLGRNTLQARKIPQALEYFNRVLCADPSNREVLEILDRLSRRRTIGRVLVLLLLGGVMGISTYLIYLYWPAPTPTGALADGYLGRDGNLTMLDLAMSTDGAASQDLRREAAARPDTARPDARRRIVRPPRLPPVEVKIKPWPMNVTIFVNNKRYGEYGPELRTVKLPATGLVKLRFSNSRCEDKVFTFGPRAPRPPEVRFKLRWKPARVTVSLTPSVPADVWVGITRTQPGRAVKVEIPKTSKDGKHTVMVRVKPNDYAASVYAPYNGRRPIVANGNELLPVRLEKQK